jgi:hypothetical protein
MLGMNINTSEVLRTRKMATKEWSAVRCIPLEEPGEMLPLRKALDLRSCEN